MCTGGAKWPGAGVMTLAGRWGLVSVCTGGAKSSHMCWNSGLFVDFWAVSGIEMFCL